MKRTRRSAEQIANKLREAEAMLAAGKSVAKIVQTLGVSEATYSRAKTRSGGMKANEGRCRGPEFSSDTPYNMSASPEAAE
jgi:putative transposase